MATTRDDGNGEKEPNGEPTGVDELLRAIAEALRSKESKEAIALLIKKFADEIPNRNKAMRRAIWMGHLVTALLLVAIGMLGYLKVISTETTGALLGAIVGGLYYSNRR